MNNPNAKRRTRIMGVGFDSLTLHDAVLSASDIITNRGKAYIVTPNPEIVMLCNKLPELMSAVNEADMVLPDGIGVIYAARILGTPLRQKLPGIDFALGLLEKMSPGGLSVFLFGAKPGVAELAASELLVLFPGIKIAGTCDGYFSDDEPIIDRINAAEPDFLMVCLGAPKQELWMKKNMERLDVPLMAGLGGSLDVFAKTVKRAPLIWQRLGLEWLYRVIKEPKRIKRMGALPLFILQIISLRIRGKKDAR